MSRLRITLVLAALSALGPFSVDTYFPSFPAIGERFGVTQLQVQQLLSFYLLALAFMTLFHGALSDSFGRRRVIITALVIYVGTAVGCVFAPSFDVLLAFRVVQGLAAGAGMIVGRAMIRDLYDGVEAQNLMAHVTMIFGVAPAVAPVVGGWMHEAFGWQGGFGLLAVLSAALLGVCVAGLPETHPVERRQPFAPRPLARSYLELARDYRFLSLSASVAFAFGGVFIYVATAPDFVLNTLHLGETQFAWLFIPIVSGLVVGSWLVTRLSARYPATTLVTGGYVLMAGATVWNLVSNALLEPSVPWAVLPLVPYGLGVALLGPNINILALDMFPARRGLASSLMGFVHVLVFALISALVAPLIHTGSSHAVAMAGMLLVSAVSWSTFRSSGLASPSVQAAGG